MRSRFVLPLLTITIAVFSFWAAAQERTPPASQSASVVAADTAAKKAPGKEVKSADDATARFEGEKRFKANCARCHAAPQKFPPRMMATITRHMRVRATLTDEDVRLILRYMTQ